MPASWLVGLDVGSTTVKAVVRREGETEVCWRTYRRHESRQAEVARAVLDAMERELGLERSDVRLFLTGSGARDLAPLVGGRFVQEVVAVALAVERFAPDVHSVVELGGQDAKIILFKPAAHGGRRKFLSMNDKCAGGTGAVIDKIAAKLRVPPEELQASRYHGVRLHPVAGKCGVFAEMDINSLQKQGIPKEELLASLFEALVLQNLTVLTRGHTLRPTVLLLGGPNVFIRGLREAWQANIARLWEERGVEWPPGATIDTLVTTPEDGVYFAALGAIEFGRLETGARVNYHGSAALAQALERRSPRRSPHGIPGLRASGMPLAEFLARYTPRPYHPPSFQPGSTVPVFVGIDAGSTSTKAVLLTPDGRVVGKAYRLSQGNPIEDAVVVLEQLRRPAEQAGAHLEVLGVATTGYAKDVLKDALGADVALVETVAHTHAAAACYPDPHVIVDVGGQDIKLIFLRDGVVRDFRLNSQCSAGNGFFLQATAESFGYRVDQYAEVAFSADEMPVFGYGCAVFLQADIVNFQRQGWRPPEILAGLAAVLPKNIWLYVAKLPNLPQLGTRFILQGGTQHNLAAVKAQVDFIRSRFEGTGVEPEIVVHEHCGEAGAVGAALEARRLYRDGHRTRFIGFEAASRIQYRTVRDESTRCSFCQNRCLRTFIHLDWRQPESGRPLGPAAEATRRVIVASCEKGAAEDLARLREVKADLDAVRAANPNLVEYAAEAVWRVHARRRVADPPPPPSWPWTRARRRLREQRASLRVGIPRVFYMYVYAPLFTVYLESLGVRPGGIVWSDFTSEALYRAGARRGAVDPCYPSKVALAHVHNLLYVKHRQKPLDCVFFPMLDVLRSPLVNLIATNACPTVTVTPETVKAAFTKEEDVFAHLGVRYVAPLLNVADPEIFARQMFEAWAPVLGLSRRENRRAVEAGFEALAAFERDLETRARAVLDRLEREHRLGIVVLGRPYHHDPGLHHGILEELQKRGYPILSQSTLPHDPDLLERLFGDEVRAGVIGHPLEISDVWKHTYSASTSHKIWAAKFVARHPNLVGLELSNFKCGHDAPIATLLEEILRQAGRPFFAFRDLDENKATGAIRIRVETIDYFLKRRLEEMARAREMPLAKPAA